MNNFWQGFLTYVTSISIIVAGLSWVIRKLIDNFFSQKIEQYKADLEKENTKYRITYEKLHTERATVIKEVYKKMVSTYEAIFSYVRPLQHAGEETQEEKRRIAAETLNDFSLYYEQNKIFFNETLAEKVDTLRDELIKAFDRFTVSREFEPRNTEGWTKIWDKVKNDIPIIKKDIEIEFRKLIGIE